jgi:ATP-binding cassette subfamily B protein AbcA/BmrA
MLKNPDYLILDEATANLDPLTEQKIKDSISALMKGRTSVIVAHSYRTVEGADQIIVMNNGIVEDCGTPEELMKRNGYFRSFAAACAE